MRESGWDASRVVREALLALEVAYPRPNRRNIIGLGKFRSDVPDLATNKKHLRGLGREQPK